MVPEADSTRSSLNSGQDDSNHSSRRPTLRTESKGLSIPYEPYRRSSHHSHRVSKSGPTRPPLRRKSTSNTNRPERLFDQHASPPMSTWSDVLFRYVTAGDHLSGTPFSPSTPAGAVGLTRPGAMDPGFDLNQESLKATRTLKVQHCQQVLDELKPETRDYLSTLFWTKFNAIHPVVRQRAFAIDLDRKSDRCYSALLHVALLAIGVRFADATRSNIRDLVLAGRESRLHRAAFLFVQAGHLRDDGVPYLQSLVLLAELEYGCGREDSARLYLDKILELQNDWERSRPALFFVSDDDLISRSMVVRLTKFLLATYFRVPFHTDSKRNFRTTQISSDTSWLRHEDIEHQIYAAQLDLICLSSDLQSELNLHVNPSISVIEALTERFERWYSELPGPLKWVQQNIETAAMSFFILHQQYAFELIMLNRSFFQAQRLDAAITGSEESSAVEHACQDNAVRIAQTMQAYSKRFRFRVGPAISVQHAGLAASMLITSLRSALDEKARAHVLSQLDILDNALIEMSPAYDQADRLSRALKGHLMNSEVPKAPTSSLATTISTPPGTEGLAGERSYSVITAPHPSATVMSGAVRRSLPDDVLQRTTAVKARNDAPIFRTSIFKDKESKSMAQEVNASQESREESEEPAESWGRSLGAVRAAMPPGHDPTLNELFGNVFQFKLIPQDGSN